MFALLVDNLPDCDVVYSVYIVYNHVISPVPLLPAGANTENRQATAPPQHLHSWCLNRGSFSLRGNSTGAEQYRVSFRTSLQLKIRGQQHRHSIFTADIPKQGFIELRRQQHGDRCIQGFIQNIYQLKIRGQQHRHSIFTANIPKQGFIELRGQQHGDRAIQGFIQR